MNCKLKTIEILILGYPFSNMSIIVWEYSFVRSCTLNARENVYGITVCK